MSALDRLLGTWRVTMHHSAMTEPVAGRQRYERTLDGAFVLMHASYDHPDFPDALAVLSDDACHYFDVRGVIRVFDFVIGEAGWSMVFLDDEFSQRHTARFDGPDTMTNSGDASTDRGTTWEHDFTLTYERTSR
jgi:hypothetical protein